LVKKRVKFKYQKDKVLFFFIDPILSLIFFDMTNYIESKYPYLIPLTITRTIDEKIPGISKSSTHEEGRAIDLRVKSWKQKELKDIMNYVNQKYAADYGTSRTGLNPCIIPDPNHGTAKHFHIQVKRF